MRFLCICTIVFSLLVISAGMPTMAQQTKKGKRILVDKNGHGDFTSIQAAINALPDSSGVPALIFVNKGIYKEKLLIQKSGFILEGEDRENTIITQAIARDEWRCSHTDDWGAATVNIIANGITLKNLTIKNSYGFDIKDERNIDCPLDTVTHRKLVTPEGHQMALRTMNNTKLKAVNCHFVAWAGDTVSPWNTVDGMYYFKNCTMEGGVDFYCPRGWAYAEHCNFIAHTGSASIWHDGSGEAEEKAVFVACSFNGFDGFKLGRYHKDAQFYLINCSFAANMADEPIYQVRTNNTIKWGKRIYYFNCHRNGADFSWYADNFDQAPGQPLPGKIDAAWVFGKRWHPAE